MTLFVIGIVVLLFLGMPVAVALGLPSIIYVVTNDIATPVITQRLFAGIDQTSLLCIPFFILAGDLMARGGIAKHLINLAKFIVGRRAGGLAIVTIISCAVFAALSGSTVGCCAALGIILIPAMVEEGYDRGFATGVVCSGSVLGPIIPPSIAMIVYASMTLTSVSSIYKAGVPAGILLAIALGVCAYIRSKRRGYGVSKNVADTPADKQRSFRQFLHLLVKALWALGTPIIILGGIFAGIATPTEAAVLAVVYSLLVSLFVYGDLKIRELPKLLLNSAKMSAKIMFIMSAAALFAWLLTYMQIPQMFVTAFLALTEQKWVVLLIMNVLMLFMGMMMDSGSIYLICLPLFMPVVKTYGVDPVHFGVVSALNLSIGAITPPFGTCLFAGADIGGVSVQKTAKNCFVFILVMIAVLLLITYLPQTIMFVIR